MFYFRGINSKTLCNNLMSSAFADYFSGLFSFRNNCEMMIHLRNIWYVQYSVWKRKWILKSWPVVTTSANWEHFFCWKILWKFRMVHWFEDKYFTFFCITEACVLSQVIFYGQSGSRPGFSPSTSVFVLLHTHIYLSITVAVHTRPK
jgi:hypothetical protein